MLRSTSVVMTTTGAVGELLVGQRFDRRGVEGLAALGQGPGARVLRHDRLPRAGGRGHEHRTVLIERGQRPELEGIELERVGARADIRAVAGHAAASRSACRLVMKLPMRMATS